MERVIGTLSTGMEMFCALMITWCIQLSKLMDLNPEDLKCIKL